MNEIFQNLYEMTAFSNIIAEPQFLIMYAIAFVLLYLIFLAILGIPILVMELAVGRASQRSVAQAFDRLEPPKTKWHYFKWVALAGQYLLMMF